MFKKVFSFDIETLFYFDKDDRKYVAKKGSLAWRTNNPGLISYRHALAKAHRAIGSHEKVAIFPSPKQGILAFRAWLSIPKYSFSFTEIANEYQPENPDEYIKKLCALAQLPIDVNLKKISSAEFERILKAVQYLNGFSQEHQGTFTPLPKITARYSSSNFELYAVGHEELITKEEAVRRIESHELDAVIVQKANGKRYLRSRPGNQLDSIRFEHPQLKKQPEFKDVLRDKGRQRPGQCIWGYINGIDNTPREAKASIKAISKFANGERVWSLVNDKKLFFSLGNLWDACLQKLGIETEVTKYAILFFRLLLDFSNKDPAHPPVIIFAHSQGAIIAKAALPLLKPEERERLRIFTLGAGAFIFPKHAHPDSHNYISIADPIPRISASSSLVQLAIRRHEEICQGLTDDDIIERLIDEEVEYQLSTTSLKTILPFRKQRRRHYLTEFGKITNITVLNEQRKGLWEHAVGIPCYQKKIQELIELYQKNQLMRSSDSTPCQPQD